MEKSNFRLRGNRVLVRQREAQQQTEGGIYLPDVASRRPLRGTVVQSVVVGIEEGNEVIYAPFAGTPVELGTEVFLILDDEDILMIA